MITFLGTNHGNVGQYGTLLTLKLNCSRGNLAQPVTAGNKLNQVTTHNWQAATDNGCFCCPFSAPICYFTGNGKGE